MLHGFKMFILIIKILSTHKLLKGLNLLQLMVLTAHSLKSPIINTIKMMKVFKKRHHAFKIGLTLLEWKYVMLYNTITVVLSHFFTKFSIIFTLQIQITLNYWDENFSRKLGKKKGNIFNFLDLKFVIFAKFGKLVMNFLTFDHIIFNRFSINTFQISLLHKYVKYTTVI